MDSSAKKLILSENLKIITHERKALLYNSLVGSAMVCHKDMLKLIDSMHRGKTINELKSFYNQSNLESVIANLKSKRFIQEGDDSTTFSKSKSLEKINNGSIINSLRLNVTSSCNMKCSYCYVETSNKQMMDWNVAKKSLDVFFNLQRKHNHKSCTVRFFGGEPLLNWPIIKCCIDYVKTIQKEIKVRYILNTNGTIFSDKIAQEIYLNNVTLAISLDGEEKEHNQYRKFKTGKESFKIIVGNIEQFLKHSCTIGVEATIGNHNIFKLNGLIDLLALLSEKFKITIPLALQHLSIVSSKNMDTIDVDKKIQQFIALFDYARLKKVNINTGLAFFPLNSLLTQRNTGYYCSATGGEICIHPSGDIYPCGALNTKLGTIHNIEGVFKSDIYHQLANRCVGNIPECRGCEIEAFCAGGCVADAFAADGIINTSAQHCELEKEFFNKYIKYFVLPSIKIAI